MALSSIVGTKGQERTYLFIVLPALIVFLIGTLVPLGIGFYYSLTDWNGRSPSFNFIGFKNYINIFTQPRFYKSAGFTLLFVLCNTVIQNIFALGLALFLDRKMRGRNFLRTIIYAPALLSPILCGYLWSKIFGEILPNLFQLLNIHQSPNLLTDPKTVLIGILIINNWQWIGYWMIIYLAGLQSVPTEIYEAIGMDGGNAWHKFVHGSLPMIAPAITICIVYITVGSFQVYELILTATNGGPGHASESLVMYIFNVAFSNSKQGFASAHSILFYVFLLILAVFQLKILTRREVQL